MTEAPAAVVVLAAGEGTRMKSARAKVLHEIAGRSLLGNVLAAVEPLQPKRTIVVVGHQRDQVVAHLGEIAPYADAVVQSEQRGTGHALRIALDSDHDIREGVVVVVPGDAPLLTAATLQALIGRHQDTQAAVTVLTANVPDPSGYGRIVRDPDGHVSRIVEHRDADDVTRQICEIGTGVYAFDISAVRTAVRDLDTDNTVGEEYLTDAVALLGRDGSVVSAVVVGDWRETVGVNDRVQLAQAAEYLRGRIVDDWMRAGVTVVDPRSTWIDLGVQLEADACLLPNVQLHGATVVRAGAVVGPNSQLTDTDVGSGAQVANSVCIGALVGAEATVGPFSYLRAGTRLGRRAKIGAYVETKAAVVGDESKVPHLSYVGDATIGERTNIGAATVFVNFDGVDKHETTVGDDVRVGSDTMLVAPVTVGDGAYTAAGSVVTDDVPPGAMAIGRARQRNVEGWVERKRRGTPSASAAQRARDGKPRTQRERKGEAQ